MTVWTVPTAFLNETINNNNNDKDIFQQQLLRQHVNDTNLSPVASSSCSHSQVSCRAASCDETETHHQQIHQYRIPSDIYRITSNILNGSKYTSTKYCQIFLTAVSNNKTHISTSHNLNDLLLNSSTLVWHWIIIIIIIIILIIIKQESAKSLLYSK